MVGISQQFRERTWDGVEKALMVIASGLLLMEQGFKFVGNDDFVSGRR